MKTICALKSAQNIRHVSNLLDGWVQSEVKKQSPCPSCCSIFCEICQLESADCKSGKILGLGIETKFTIQLDFNSQACELISILIQFHLILIHLDTVACESLGTPCRICENVNNFNKIREIIQNACYFLFSTVLSKIFYIKYVYI